MKKLYFAVLILLCVHEVSACDICGCSAGNYFIGPFPQFRKHFFGLRYSFRSFHSEVSGDATQFSKDFYQTTELWGGINVGKKWQIIGFLPYNINKQVSDDGIKRNSAFGDVTLIANYKILNKKNATKKGNVITQVLWIGGGIKLPTGKFKADPDDIIPDANNQPGTGSFDFLINTLYTIHIDDWGVNSNINYKINGRAGDYRFGNRFNLSSFFFRSFIDKKKTWIPNAGFTYESLKENKLNKAGIESSGGKVLLAAAGLETVFKKLNVGFNFQYPLAQNLSAGQTHSGLRGMVHLTYTF